MSIKDEVEFVKDSLTGDEKILENAFKLERLYKKHRMKLWAGIVVVLLLIGGKFGMQEYKGVQLDSANKSLLALEKNPKNEDALANLKAKNPKLFELFRYSQAVKNSNIKTLEKLSKTNDKLIADISKYHMAVLQSKTTNSQYYNDLVLIEEAYNALKEKKKTLANQKLSLIGENSPVSSVARLLRHYALESK